MDEGTGVQGGMRRLGRAERREQILNSAARALVRRGGFAATSLDDVAAESGVTRMILYRHFASRAELYQAVIDCACDHLYAATTANGVIGDHSVPGMLDWAVRDPDGFRLLFHFAARDPEFGAEVEEMRTAMVQRLYAHLSGEAVDPEWAGWAASLATTVTIEAIMAWLDAGRPEPERAAERVLAAVDGVFRAIGVH